MLLSSLCGGSASRWRISPSSTKRSCAGKCPEARASQPRRFISAVPDDGSGSVCGGAVAVRLGPVEGARGGRQVALDGKVLLRTSPRASKLSPPRLADRVSEVPQIVFETRRPLRIRWIRSFLLPIAAAKLHDLYLSLRLRECLRCRCE